MEKKALFFNVLVKFKNPIFLYCNDWDIQKIMLKYSFKKLLLGFTCCQVFLAMSQDPTFSQFYTAGLYLNPAIIALEETATLSAHSRTQWRETGANFQTNQLSVMVPIPRKEVLEGFWGGVGISAFQDKSVNGTLNTGGVNVTFSTNVKMSKKSQVTLGIQGGMIQKSVDLNSFTWASQYNPFIGYDGSIDPGIGGIGNKVFLPDVSAGVLYFYNYNEDFNDSKMDGYVGLSAYHLNQANEALVTGATSKLPILYKLHAGLDIQLGYKMSLNPNVLVTLQADNMQVNAGTYFNYLFSPLVERWNPAFVMIGGWYRLQDAFIMSAGMGGAYYTLAFSYDMNASSLRDVVGNASAYELSLKLKKPAKKLKSHHTPRM